MKRIILLLGLFANFTTSAQIFGTITDERGDTLPFSNVIIAGTTNGTSSNGNGYYELNLDKGKHKIIFQYLGYIPKEKVFEISEDPQEYNPVLKIQTMSLAEIEVKADKEDPAYEIIRKVKKKRKYFKDLMPKYECDVYIKGFQKVKNVPEKIMGVEIGDMGGALDSTRSGVIYLSESLSKYYKDGKETKEKLVYSKVSGDNSGMSFNRAKDLEFEMYNEYISLGGMKNVLSPIASNAFLFYRYKLMGMYYENGQGIYSIKITPKNDLAPLFSGIININDDLWNINSLDFDITGKSIGIPLLDTLSIIQAYIPHDNATKWSLFSQNLTFGLNFFGMKINGLFKAIYTGYIEDTEGAEMAKNQIFSVTKDANKITELLWDTLRPIPLTLEEKTDYFKKDSIYKKTHSKEYMDSVDIVNNKFKLKSLLTTYYHDNSYKNSYWRISSPLMNTGFNPVQGLVLGSSFVYSKSKDDDNTAYHKTKIKAEYGFANQNILLSLREKIKFDDIKNKTLTIDIGNRYFPLGKTILKPLDLYYVLYQHKNYRPIYKNTFAQVHYSQEIATGLILKTKIGGYKRTNEKNNTEFSFKEKDKQFTPNEELVGELYEKPYFKFGLSFDYTPNMKFSLTDKSKEYYGSKWPTFSLVYSTAQPINYHKINIGLVKTGMEVGISGYSNIDIDAGKVFSDKLYFADYFHFKGNEIFLMSTSSKAFHALPYFDYSTNDQYLQAHYTHHFDGLLLSRIPLLKRLLFKSLVGYKTLLVPGQKQYQEVFAGIENIGWGMYRFLRVDFTANFIGAEYQKFGITLGLSMNGIGVQFD